MMRRCRWLLLLLFCCACASSGSPTATTGASMPPATTPAQNGGVAPVVIGGVRGGPPGSRASASVTAPPQTRCSIAVTAPDGHAINAAGLEPKATDAQGRAMWTWQIPPMTPAGIGTVDIACGGVHAAPVRLFIG